MSTIFRIVYGVSTPLYNQLEISQWQTYGEVEMELIHFDMRYPDFLLKYLPMSIAPWRKAVANFTKACEALYFGLRDQHAKGGDAVMGGNYMDYLIENQDGLGLSDEELW